MPFPKNATLAGHPIKILGPRTDIVNGEIFTSHTESVIDFQGMAAIVANDQIKDVEVVEAEIAEYEAKITAIFPDAVRIAKAITGQ